MFRSPFNRPSPSGGFGRRTTTFPPSGFPAQGGDGDNGIGLPPGPVASGPARSAEPPANRALATIARLDPDYPGYELYFALPEAERQKRDLTYRRAAEALASASASERSGLVVAIAATGMLADYKHLRPTDAAAMRCWRLYVMLEQVARLHAEFELTPELFGGAARLLGETKVWGAGIHTNEAWQKRLKAISAAGHVPDEEEKAWLAGWKAQLAERYEKDRRYALRADLRKSEAIMKWIDKICGTEVGEAAIVERLSTPPAKEGRFPDRPPHFDFWLDFIAAAAGELDRLLGELKKDPSPAWLRDESVYAERFPAVEGISRPFGWWDEDQGGANFGEPPLRGINWALHCALRAARASDYRDCVDAPETLGTLNLVWSSDAVPQAARLADSADPAQADLLLHLAASKAGAKPPAAWLGKARKLVAAIGADAARARLTDRLEQFARVAPDAAASARLHNHFTLVTAATWLQSVRPDLPSCGDPAEVSRAATALALHAGGRYVDQSFLFCDAASGRLGSVAGLNAASCGGVWTGDWVRWKPSLTNESVLRGVAWLLGDHAEPDVVDLLERSVDSAIAYSDSHGARSRSTANAAIASLARIGTAEAAEALGRIRRSVKDKAVANSVAKAIDSLAGVQGVSSSDIEEMCVPSYGFD